RRRPGHHRHRQHRHRRLGPRAADARAGDAQVREARPETAFRFQHRPGRPRGGTRGADPGNDFLHRRIEDVHDRRDPSQCGGRSSIWSPVGLPVALAAGMSAFEELLEGARGMDAHFLNEPLERNMPVVLALLEIWYVNFFGAQTRAVIPYSEDLRDLPAYLQ